MILSHSAFLEDLITEGAAGQVLGVYRRSFYAELRRGGKSQVVAVVDVSLGRGPLNLVARELIDPPVAVGDPVEVSNGYLRAGLLVLPLRETRAWDPTVRVRRSDLMPEAVEACFGFVVREAPPTSLAALLPVLRGEEVRLDPWQQTALCAARRLLDGLRTGTREGVAEGAAGLAGLGPGLTPSGDDFLCGLLLGLWVAGELEFVPTILRTAQGTHRISRAYLWAAARGGASEAWHHLLSSLRTGQGWEKTARRVLHTGETSGADALAGFLSWWVATPARTPRTGRRRPPLP